MTGAINYVRREERYVMNTILSLLFQYCGPHRTFNSNGKHGGNGVFIIYYSRILLLLQRSF